MCYSVRCDFFSHLFKDLNTPITLNCVRVSSSLQVLFRGTYWIRFWALLQKEEERPLVLEGCRALECSAMEIFVSNGWPFINRIAYV